MSNTSLNRTIRDPRLDFYRGLAMFIIFMAHVPGNWLNQWIPARFGFSDAAEIFVFCSGMASAVAFGRTYDRSGWFLGTARILFRVWQIYWAHIATFLVTAMMLGAITFYGDFDKNYIGSLNLWKFFEETPQQLFGLFTLSYVPNYFDILPMYIVILVMVPIVMALSRVNLWLVAAFVLLTWFSAQGKMLEHIGFEFIHINLPAEPWSNRSWFFNPFGWQLVFFTGFAFMRGWLPMPKVNLFFIAAVFAVLGASMLVSHVAIRDFGFTWAREWRVDNLMWIDKTDNGLIRFVHFLAVAYFGWLIAGPDGKYLRTDKTSFLANTWRIVVKNITKVGQQSLAVFIISIVAARLAGFVLDQIGKDFAQVLLINLVGFAILLLTAYLVGWFKSTPWKKAATS